MYTVAKAALEAVAIEQRQKQLKVLFLAVMGRCRHQKEVPCESRKEFSKVIALGVLDFAAEYRGRELMGLVADNQVPSAVRGLQFLLHVFVPREFVESGNDEVVFEEPIASPSRL